MKKKFDTTLILEANDFDASAIERIRNFSDNLAFGLSDVQRPTGVEVIITRLKYYIDDEFVSPFPKLKYILSPTTGETHISPAILNHNIIKVITLKNHTRLLWNITSTPELAWGLFLNLARNVVTAFDSVKNNVWDRDQFKGRQINGMKIGIIGFGRVGQKIAQYAQCFGCDIIWNDPNPTCSDNLKQATNTKLFTLAKQSDAVFICASYRSGDTPIVTEKFLKNTAKKPFLINTSRANLIDEKAVCAALEKGTITAIATDVLKGEEQGTQSHSEILLRSLNHDDVLITPHIAGCTVEAMSLTENIILDVFLNELSVYSRAE